MINLYGSIILQTPASLSAIEKVTFFSSVLRSVLQVAAISSIEICIKNTPDNEIDLESYLNRMQHPSDGLPIEIIEKVLPCLRVYVDRNIGSGWYREQGASASLAVQLNEWVQFRNDTAGHGVLGESDAILWAEKLEKLIELCLVVLKGLMPTYDGERNTFSLCETPCFFPFTYDSLPIVIRNIRCQRGIWKLNGRRLSRSDAKKFTVELSGSCIFSQSSKQAKEEYSYSDSIYISDKNKSHTFLHNIPHRQTGTFEGRGKELIKLTDWLNDDDERACLVFGDGGFGKTTLVLEFLNRLLEDKIELNKPRPQVISFYTAKMTRWTDQGLEHLKGVSDAMDECVRELIRAFDPVLTKDWYEANGDKLIQKAIGYLKETGFDRDDILFVFDNTETVATSTHEVENLGEFLQTVSKKIGKMIVTSRRREFINATPISVRGLTEIECVNLINRLSKEYHATPLIQAGESRLRNISKQLMYKPLLINTLIKHISRTDCGISSAMDSLFKKSNDELLDFLYQDAWARMSSLQQKVYMLLVSSDSPLDHFSVSEACMMMEIPLTEFHSTFDETYFGSVINRGERFSIELEELALRFFIMKVKELPAEEKNTLEENAMNLDITVKKYHDIENEYKSDRVADAFRSTYAKAARTHVRKSEFADALEMYEIAIDDDPMNSALKDRFAWFLYHKIATTQAKTKADDLWRESIELNGNNCDAIVNLALSRYRNDDLLEGDELMEKARRLSRSYSFCLLNQAKARIYYWLRNKNASDATETLIAAAKLLEQARRRLDINEQYYAKNRDEINHYSARLQNLATRKVKLTSV
ncbi:hypothetical protein BCT30_04965 [Enterovibrio norvegicus]|uniref:ATP-binding protein n=1 Tax=Enterovibrio norvegicus TaxID=188144 RepID=UPI000C8328A1|nr:ATP-binding protein [Enterovibrio norvegicus]PMI33524.1 hypothetical protein BCU46_22275 [Enterovibrio norvegicus]PMN44251.1 hypothetical protein BCT30_04965 [Enterovibrio norvegicus]